MGLDSFCTGSKPVTLVPLPAVALGANPGIGAALDGQKTTIFEVCIELPDCRTKLFVSTWFGDLNVLCAFEVLTPAAVAVASTRSITAGYAIRLDLGGLVLPLGQPSLRLAFMETEFEPLVERGLVLETHPEPVAVARALVGTEYGGVRENDLPDVLKDAAGHGVADGRAKEPSAVMFVRLLRDREDAVPAQGKLRAARLRQDLGNGLAGEELGPRLGDHRLFEFFLVRLDFPGVDPFRAPWHPVATHVHVPVAEDTFRGEAFDHLRGVEIEEVVVVPGELVAVHEDTDVGEVFVEFYDVRQVGHDFVTLVLRWVVWCFGVVGHVDDLGESGAQVVLIEPGDIVGLHPCHDEVACVLSCGRANWCDADGTGVKAKGVRPRVGGVGIRGLVARRWISR